MAEASLLARMKIAETEADLKINGRDDIASILSGDFGEIYPGYMWHRTILSMSETALESLDSMPVTIQDDLAKCLVKIEIKIVFKDQYSFIINTWRFVEAGY